MALTVNLHHLAANDLHVHGELSVAELDIETRDDMIQVSEPLHYDLKIEKLQDALLLEGDLKIRLQCQCVRCLTPFEQVLELKDWTIHVPLEGEEATLPINDCVDLTPFVREDILLAFPQHPLCDPQCRGLPNVQPGKAKKSRAAAGQTQANLSAWAELNKLKF